MTDVTELAQSLKAAAEKYKSVWGIARYSKAVEAREKFHELVTPANVIALVEALEKAQQRITQLESRTVKLPDFVCVKNEVNPNSLVGYGLSSEDASHIVEWMRENGFPLPS